MGHLAKITRELQDLSMSMRMVPIHGVFQKMARLVRDLGRKFGKEINLEVVGGETELDRNVVEAISDPLVHMVRNSVDHGIETPDLRTQSGKSRAGRVELKAYHQAGNIVIDITDDGKGLNKKRILQKAIQAGIVREGQELSEQEIFKLIFHAGLSTAEKVTDVSGRGVGMDVVRKNVEALRGRIDITSVEGKGSTFTIRLPLTLAVIDGMVVRVGDERYIIPITTIEQSIQPKPDQVSTVQGRGEVCMVRGDLIPLFRLHRIFNVKPKTENPCESLVVIVQDNDRRACLLVDELLGQQQVVIKSLGERAAAKGISGGAILGDGNVSLILDIPGLMELAAEQGGRRRLAA
jgi:two-component system chemotaxis sensor kinase CheA